MLKGCKKNVVYVKNTGSEMFEEAYFIISGKAKDRAESENDMLLEASRIISSSPVASYFKGEDTKAKKEAPVSRAVYFFLGAAIMAAINAIIYMLI